MHVVARKTILEYGKSHASAVAPLDVWYRLMRKGTYQSLAELKEDFPSVDLISGETYVFNIGGNNYRLVAQIKFKAQAVYIKAILTHAEYDKDKWKR
jgi:mRNA interferase HigB